MDEFDKLLQAHEDATMAVAIVSAHVAPDHQRYREAQDAMLATRDALREYVRRLLP